MELPWDLDIDVHVDETIGMAVWRLGLYDLMVSEALWRLADPGERAADIGANVGHMTSLLARRLTDRGKVTSFEPMPEIYAQLDQNVKRWRTRAHVAELVVEKIALSDRNGQAELVLPAEMGANSGIAYLKETRAEGALGPSIQVEVRPMDEYFTSETTPQIIKIDVEGAELNVYRGGEKLLRSGAVRDLVFEENAALPTPATRYLEELGFRLFRLEKTFLGPTLADPLSPSAPTPWEPPNFLATRDADRALARFQPRGWKCLRMRE